MAFQTAPDPEAGEQLTDGTAGYVRERAELARLLESETFRRSPKVSRLVSYLCEKYFRDEADEICEYSIAVDALGRDSKFDPQLDAIVRVDTYHLRKRLKQFYAAEGRDHEIRIVIPAGQYTPKFEANHNADNVADNEANNVDNNIANNEAQPAAEVVEETSPASTAVAGADSVRQMWRPATLAIAATLGVAMFVAAAHWRKPATPPVALVPEGDEIRIAAGNRADYIDKTGRRWMADRYFTGGTVFHRGHDIQRTRESALYESGREGQFAYEIPLKPGIYELRLHFAETAVTSEALRGVNVAINGIPLSTLDVANDAGGIGTATVKIFKDISPAKDGVLHLTFQGDPGFVNALEILPGIRGKMRPIRFTAGETAYRDHLGQLWLPDEGFAGGRKSARAAQVTGTDDPGLYVAQRYGHFSYSIPVAEQGRYALTLHFAETWFGKTVGGIGSRVFDVYSNGTTLLKGFDILKESGGVADWAVVKTFRNLAPSPQGKLELSFVPISNYALLAAVEVVEE